MAETLPGPVVTDARLAEVGMGLGIAATRWNMRGRGIGCCRVIRRRFAGLGCAATLVRHTLQDGFYPLDRGEMQDMAA